MGLIFQANAENLATADTPKARLYRATNKWVGCASDVARGVLQQHSDEATPQEIAEASVDACMDERAIVRALAHEMARFDNHANPDATASAIEF